MNRTIYISSDPEGLIAAPKGGIFYRVGENYYLIDSVGNETRLSLVTKETFLRKKHNADAVKSYHVEFQTPIETWTKADNNHPSGPKYGWSFTSFQSPTFVDGLAPTPTPTPTVTPSNTPSFTPTPTVSMTPTGTPEVTITPTPTPTPEVTVTPSVSTTPEVTTTPTPSVTAEVTGTPQPTETPTQTPTLTPTPTAEPIIVFGIDGVNYTTGSIL